MSQNTISHSFVVAGKRPPTQVALRYSKNGKWTDISWPEYYSLSERLAGALVSRGIKRGDRVAIMSNTRYQWNVADMAILGLGAVTVPLYQNSTAEDVEFILKNSGAVAVLLEDSAQFQKLEILSDKLPTLKTMIAFCPLENSKVIQWEDALKLGSDYLKSHPDFFKNSAEQNQPSEIATIVYTSGTTGQPKGAVLLHSCISSECDDLKPILDVNDSDSTLTFLPFAHIFGRVELWVHVHFGWKMAFAESIDRISANLVEIKPTFMLAVPRIFEKIYSRILSQVEEGSEVKKKIFHWAIALGQQVSKAKQAKKSVPLTTLIQYRLAFKLVFSKLHAKMGNRIRFLVSGGAPLSKEIIEFFHAAGILVLEGYGLTETTAGIFFNNPYKYRFGSVGLPVGDVKVKFESDGEILVQSKKVFKEYFGNPEATAESLTADGWFHTGDIGVQDTDGFLKITDRKKDLIKTAGGKMIAPQKIENLLKLNKLISQVVVYGDRQKYLVALVTLNGEELVKYAESHGLPKADYAALTKDSRVHDMVRDIIKGRNSQLASYETIKNFSILPQDFTTESGELTPSLKVKRKLIAEKYDSVVKELYS